MADWFKLYENDLDETRLQWAIGTLSEVTPVWIGILSECCRHKSDTIRWGSNEIELFGFSRRLNISIPKVNESVNLLIRIDYIEKGENTLKVLKWTSKQSEYCQKKAAKTPDSVGTVSGQCRPRQDKTRQEEKRGEEINFVNKGFVGLRVANRIISNSDAWHYDNCKVRDTELKSKPLASVIEPHVGRLTEDKIVRAWQVAVTVAHGAHVDGLARDAAKYCVQVFKEKLKEAK